MSFDKNAFFRLGSVIVDYKVAVLKGNATKTLGAIVDSIKTEGRGGTFGNYNVDVASVSGAGKLTCVLSSFYEIR